MPGGLARSRNEWWSGGLVMIRRPDRPPDRRAPPWGRSGGSAPAEEKRPTRPVSGDWPRPHARRGKTRPLEVSHHGRENLVNSLSWGSGAIGGVRVRRIFVVGARRPGGPLSGTCKGHPVQLPEFPSRWRPHPALIPSPGRGRSMWGFGGRAALMWAAEAG